MTRTSGTPSQEPEGALGSGGAVRALKFSSPIPGRITTTSSPRPGVLPSGRMNRAWSALSPPRSCNWPCAMRAVTSPETLSRRSARLLTRRFLASICKARSAMRKGLVLGLAWALALALNWTWPRAWSSPPCAPAPRRLKLSNTRLWPCRRACICPWLNSMPWTADRAAS